MSAWNKHKSEIVEAVTEASSREAAVATVEKILGKDISYDALHRQWLRWKNDGIEAAQKPLHLVFEENREYDEFYEEHSGEISAAQLDSADKLKLPPSKQRVKGKPTTVLRPKPGERWLIPGDLHFGIQDDIAISLMMQCAEDWEIDRCILQGDTLDCYGISRHDKRTDRIRSSNFSLQDEANEAHYFFSWVKKTREMSYLMPGNHEDRIWAVEDKNMGLHGSLSIRGLFKVPKEICVLPQFSRITAGSLTIEHGHKLPGSLGQYGAAKVLRDHPDQCTIFGHTHRMASSRKTTYDRHGRPRTRMAMTIGHMSIAERHIDYAPDANWQQGFCLVEFWEDKHGKLRYTIYLVEIHDHEFCFNGKHYK